MPEEQPTAPPSADGHPGGPQAAESERAAAERPDGPDDDRPETAEGDQDALTADELAAGDEPHERHLLLFRKDRFWQVEREEGHWRKIGRPIWRPISYLAACGDLAYAVEDGTLLRVHPASGHWGIVGKKYDYLNAINLAGHGDFLYCVHHTRLWRIDPKDGSYEWIGGHRDWEGDVRIVPAGDHLVMLEKERLFLTEPETGRWRPLSDFYTYVDTTDICSDGQRVYAIVRGHLIEVRPDDGANRVITGQIWRGNALMAADERFVYILNRHRLSKVDVETGAGYWLSDPLEWSHVSHMVLV
jgi:hypothetical protein